MGIFKKTVKDIRELDENLMKAQIDTCEDTVQRECVVRKIIDGKLYDTSKAKRICDMVLPHSDIPGYKLVFCFISGEDVVLYRGITCWFIVYGHGIVHPVEEEWVRNILGLHNADKYIELFGEPELA